MTFCAALLCLLLSSSYAEIVVNPLSGITDNNLAFSGSLPISDTSNSTLFFTYYGINGEKDQQSLKNSPLLIFVGNLGSSAQFMSIGGIGPLKLNNDMTLSENPDSSNAYANTMFVDLLGSGFSFAQADQLSEKEADYSKQLSYALNAFIKESSLGQSSSISLIGEGSFVRSLPGLDQIINLKSIVHVSPWTELYAMGKFAGVAGVDLEIFSNSEKIAIETTFSGCYNYLAKQKYAQARVCYDTILNFVQDKTSNSNLFNVALKQNLTDFLPLTQYYFSMASTVEKFKAPKAAPFESQAKDVYYKLYTEQAKNYTKEISTFTRDYLDVKHIFFSADKDYISYRKAVRNWVENELSFVESPAFIKKSLDDIILDGKKVGYYKTVSQVAYAEVFDAGHYAFHDQNAVMKDIMKQWVAYVQKDSKSTFVLGEGGQYNLVVQNE